MNCESVKHNAALYLCDELPDDARHELEIHVSRCAACAHEVGEVRELHAALHAAPMPEPSPSLLAASRMHLQDALESTEQSRGWSRFSFDLAGWLHSLALQPALAAMLVIAGFAGGVFATYSTGRLPHVASNTSGMVTADTASVAQIRGISQQGDNVQIQYDKLMPETAQGSINDPRIQQLLLYAARNQRNSGVRLDSIDALAQKPEDEHVRAALIYALRSDKNPGVRLKAINALSAYVKQDKHVRDAIIEALLRDDNSGVRFKAISALEPVTADSTVRQTLVVLSERDSNKFIREESRRLLAQMPQVE